MRFLLACEMSTWCIMPDNISLVPGIKWKMLKNCHLEGKLTLRFLQKVLHSHALISHITLEFMMSFANLKSNINM